MKKNQNLKWTCNSPTFATFGMRGIFKYANLPASVSAPAADAFLFHSSYNYSLQVEYYAALWHNSDIFEPDAKYQQEEEELIVQCCLLLLAH